MERARRPERLPTVMTKTEGGRVLSGMSGGYGLKAGCLKIIEAFSGFVSVLL